MSKISAADLTRPPNPRYRPGRQVPTRSFLAPAVPPSIRTPDTVLDWIQAQSNKNVARHLKKCGVGTPQCWTLEEIRSLNPATDRRGEIQMTLSVHQTRREVDDCWGSRGDARNWLAGSPGGPSYEHHKPPHCSAPTYRLTGLLSFYSSGLDCRFSVSPEVAV